MITSLHILRRHNGKVWIYRDGTLDPERLLAAEKDAQRIAVEVKSFVSASEMQDLTRR